MRDSLLLQFPASWLQTALITALGLSASPDCHAELKALDDSTMSDVYGQAYIQVDHYVNPDNQAISYTRTQLGMDIDTQINIKELELGNYPRWDAKRNDWEPKSADIHIKNFAIGHIYDQAYYTTNPLLPVPKKADGSSYQNGEIVPFHIVDPYLETAMEKVNGKDQLVGVRIGFGGAEGTMSGDILSLTGNVNVNVRTNLAYVANQVGACTASPELCAALALEPLLGQVSVTNPAKLVYPKGTNPPGTAGEIDEARATTIGIPNGSSMDANVGPASVGLTAEGCMVATTDVCFPLSQYKSLWVGKRDQYGNIDGPASGMFMAFATKALPWLTSAPKENMSENYMNTVPGAFLNIPNGVLEVDTASAMLGTPRVRTEFIDRGQGLF